MKTRAEGIVGFQGTPEHELGKVLRISKADTLLLSWGSHGSLSLVWSTVGKGRNTGYEKGPGEDIYIDYLVN